MSSCTAAEVPQLDGGPYQGGDCVAAADAMLIERSTCGAQHPTAKHIRFLTEDTSGGLLLDQVRYVNRAAYGIVSEQDNSFDITKLPAAMEHRGGIVLFSYGPIAGTKYDCFRGNFHGNHGVWADSYNAVKRTYRIADPGADGRYPGCPKGYQDYPAALLRKAAGLLVADDAGNRLGDGNVQVLFSRPDAVLPPPTHTGPLPKLVLSGPPPTEENVMLTSAYGVSGTKRMSLVKGQPIFRKPGGAKLTAMSAAYAPPHIGHAGVGWEAVLIGTGSPYSDKKTRPTVGYVPTAAGPIA